MKRGNLTSIGVSIPVKEMLIELKKLNQSPNWDKFFLNLSNDVMERHGIDLTLDADTIKQLEEIKQQK